MCFHMDLGGFLTLSSSHNDHHLKAFVDKMTDNVLLPFPGTSNWTEYVGSSSVGNWEKFRQREPFGLPCSTMTAAAVTNNDRTSATTDDVFSRFSQQTVCRFYVKDYVKILGLKTNVIRIL